MWRLFFILPYKIRTFSGPVFGVFMLRGFKKKICNVIMILFRQALFVFVTWIFRGVKNCKEMKYCGASCKKIIMYIHIYLELRTLMNLWAFWERNLIKIMFAGCWYLYSDRMSVFASLLLNHLRVLVKFFWILIKRCSLFTKHSWPTV